MTQAPMKIILSLFLCLTLILSACSGPEEKKMKFMNKGKALYEEKDYTMARLEFKNAVQIDVNFAEGYYYLGLVELGDKNYPKAFSLFNKAHTLAPENTDVQIELGKLHLAARQTDKAKEYSDSVLSADPSNIKGLLLRSSLLVSQGKTTEAETILNQLKTNGITDPQLYLLLSACYQKASSVDKSENIILEGKTKNPNDLSLKVALLFMYKKNNDNEKLINVLKEIIALEPTKNEHKFALADVYWNMGRKDEAGALLEETLTESDDKEVTYKNYIDLANFYVRLKETDPAGKTLIKGLELFDGNPELILALSQLYYGTQKPEEGYAILKDALQSIKDEKDSGLIKIKTRLAEIHVLNNEKEQAATLIEEILSISPKNMDALYMQAVLNMADGHYEDAITALRTVVAEKPDFPNGHLNLVKSYLMNNQEELAYDSLKRAVSTIPQSRELRMVLIRYHMKKNDFINAEKEFDALQKIYPNDDNVLAAFGDFYLSQKKFDQAMDKYAVIKAKHPDQIMGHMKTANAYTVQNQKDKAMGELQTALSLSPDNPNVISAMVQVLAEKKQFAKATDLCKEQIGKKNEEAFYYNLLGRLHATEKKYDLAEKDLQKASEMKPNWREPHLNLAKLYVAQGKQKTAIQTFESMATQNPDNMSATMILAILYEQDKQYGKAITKYKTIVNAMPDNLEALNNLAYLMGEHPDKPNDLTQAIGYAQRVVEKQPKSSAAQDTLAWLYYRSGQIDKAHAILNQVLADQPDNPEIYYHAGMVYFKQEKYEEAKQALEKALADGQKDFHGYEDAKSALDQVNAKLNG